MPHVQLTFELGGVDPRTGEDTCFALGALAVTLMDARDDPVLEPAPGEVRLWPATRLQALFPAASEPRALALTIAAALELPAASIDAQVLADRVWEREWLKDFHAMRFGQRLWVSPHHETVQEPRAVVVSLDPGLAFGTGTHPTTASCLRWLDAHIEGGERVIDYGCGSGILAIAAAKLGARCIECFDIDPQALTATRGNATRNGVTGRVLPVAQETQLSSQVDLLLANILFGTLCRLVRRFAKLVRPGGRVVLAGVTEEQESAVAGAYAAWFDMRRFEARNDWITLIGLRYPYASQLRSIAEVT